MPTSKVRSGNARSKISRPVPDGIAALMAAIFSSLCASFTILWANTLVYVGPSCFTLAFGLLAGDDVERHHAVIFVRGAFRRRIAFALLGDDMHQDRPVLRVAHVLEHR